MITHAAAQAVKRRHADRLMGMPGVIGVGVQRQAGEYVLAVHLAAGATEAARSIPQELDGCPVRIVRSEPFRKQDT